VEDDEEGDNFAELTSETSGKQSTSAYLAPWLKPTVKPTAFANWKKPLRPTRYPVKPRIPVRVKVFKVGGTMNAMKDGIFYKGQVLVSPNKQCGAFIRANGNFAVSCNNTFLWTTTTAVENTKNGIPFLTIQADGNMQLFNSSGIAGWQSATWATQALPNGTVSTADPYDVFFRYLVMQDDGNLVLYVNDTAIWATGTRAVLPTLTLTGVAPDFRDGQLRWNQRLRSPDGGCLAIMQHDANFVVYCRGPTTGSLVAPVWSTNTFRKGARQNVLSLHPDGNLVMRDKLGAFQWSSDSIQTQGTGFVIFALFSSRSDQHMLLASLLCHFTRRVVVGVVQRRFHDLVYLPVVSFFSL
jgi:hypothetical protein